MVASPSLVLDGVAADAGILQLDRVRLYRYSRPALGLARHRHFVRGAVCGFLSLPAPSLGASIAAYVALGAGVVVAVHAFRVRNDYLEALLHRKIEQRDRAEGHRAEAAARGREAERLQQEMREQRRKEALVRKLEQECLREEKREAGRRATEESERLREEKREEKRSAAAARAEESQRAQADTARQRMERGFKGAEYQILLRDLLKADDTRSVLNQLTVVRAGTGFQPGS